MSMRQMAWKRVKEPWEWDKVKFEEAEGDVKEIRGFFSLAKGICVCITSGIYGAQAEVKFDPCFIRGLTVCLGVLTS